MTPIGDRRKIYFTYSIVNTNISRLVPIICLYMFDSITYYVNIVFWFGFLKIGCKYFHVIDKRKSTSHNAEPNVMSCWASTWGTSKSFKQRPNHDTFTRMKLIKIHGILKTSQKVFFLIPSRLQRWSDSDNRVEI